MSMNDINERDIVAEATDADGQASQAEATESPAADPMQADDEGPLEDGAGTASPELTLEEQAEAKLRSEGEHMEAELSTLHDRHLRLAAEFDNYRKRAQSEMTESWVRAQADLIRRLLDPLDDIKRVSALDLENATVEAIMEGIDLVERKMERALAEAGLEEINPEGGAFDPNMMEAMMRVPAEEEADDDTVHQVFQKGYVLKGHLVRPARVSVYKHG